MELRKVKYLTQTNLLEIVCDCGHEIYWPVGILLVECVKCGREELWKDDWLKTKEYKNYKVMENKIPHESETS